MKKNIRTTIILPEKLVQELKEEAEQQDKSITELIRYCIRFGLTAIRISKDPNSDLVFREKTLKDQVNGVPQFEYKDRIIQFVEFLS